jgi:hypothetical protein
VKADYSAYAVRRRDTGREIVRVFDLKVGDVFVLLFHMCRNFSVEVDCPVEFPEDSCNGSPGYLWVSVDKKAELDDAVRRDPRITWEFVCFDLFNGEECAFYRDRRRMAVSIEQVARQYFASTADEIC